MEKLEIPFNKFYLTGNEEKYISDSLKQNKISGANKYTRLSEKILEEKLNVQKVFLTPSCTAALEMVPLLLDLKIGDEVIMPSFTFVSTANAFVLRGVTPVFIDIKPGNFNIDENKIEEMHSRTMDRMKKGIEGSISSENETVKKDDISDNISELEGLI